MATIRTMSELKTKIATSEQANLIVLYTNGRCPKCEDLWRIMQHNFAAGSMVKFNVDFIDDYIEPIAGYVRPKLLPTVTIWSDGALKSTLIRPDITEILGALHENEGSFEF